MAWLEKFSQIWKRSKPAPKGPMDQYLSLVKKEPGNAKAHLKLAEMYQKQGDKKRAISEYLMAAEIFLKNQFYARAMAIYKQVPKQDPSLDHVYLKIADIYRKMGFLGDAFAQYRILAQHYDAIGAKEKALEVLNMMAEMDPRKVELKQKVKIYQESMSSAPPAADGEKPETEGSGPDSGDTGKAEARNFFDLGAQLESQETGQLAGAKEISSMEKIYGFEEIFKELKENSGPSAVDPNFNYNLGVASREMGFLEDAIEQFQTALAMKQNVFDAANLLGLCHKERGEWKEAAQAFQKALQVPGAPREKILKVKYELGLVYRQMGKSDEALGLLEEISVSEPKVGQEKLARA